MKWKILGLLGILLVAGLLAGGKAPRPETVQERAVRRALDLQHERLGGLWPDPYSVKVEPRKDGLWLITLRIELIEVTGGVNYFLYDPRLDRITSYHMEE